MLGRLMCVAMEYLSRDWTVNKLINNASHLLEQNQSSSWRKFEAQRKFYALATVHFARIRLQLAGLLYYLLIKQCKVIYVMGSMPQM